MKPITSRSNPLVGAFRALAAEPDPGGARLLLDGVHLVREAVDAGLTFECLAVTSSCLDAGGEEGAVARARETAGDTVAVVPDAVMRAMSPVQHPSGVIAIVRRAPDSGLDVHGSSSLLLVLADVQDPGNLGALVRVAEAAGASRVIVTGASARPFGWKAVRGSMGSLLRMPVSRVPDTVDALDGLLGSSVRLVAATPHGGIEPDAADWRGGVALVLGGEGDGLTQAVLDRCDTKVSIPMASPVESLNVATAGAILLYAAKRQRP